MNANTNSRRIGAACKGKNGMRNNDHPAPRRNPNPCIQAFIEYEYTCSGLKPLEELREFLE
jgi:hypothetical protein